MKSWEKVSILLIVALCLGEHGCNRESAIPQGVTMQLAPSKTEYWLGENILLPFTISNNGTPTCSVIADPTLTLRILSAHRDREEIKPWDSFRTYPDGFKSLIKRTTVPLGPTDQLHVQLVGHAVSLSENQSTVVLLSASSHPDESGIIELRNLDSVGTYTFAVQYTLPEAAKGLFEQCQIISPPVTIKITVKQR